MDFNETLAQILGDDLRRVGLTRGGASVLRELDESALVERSLAADAHVSRVASPTVSPLDEAKSKNPANLEADREITVRGQTYSPRKGLEGPFHYKSGRVLYYDSKEGKYLDPTRDMYLDTDDVIESLTESASERDIHPDVAAALGQFRAVNELYHAIPDVDILRSGADPLKLEEAGVRGNPYHARSDGKFTSPAALQRDGSGSFSKHSTPKSKSKVKGAGKNGKPRFARTPDMCGRAARQKGMNVRCWTGRPYPEGQGKAAEHTKAQPRSGKGRGWRKGQTDRSVGRRMMRRESVELEFRPLLVEGEAKIWDLHIGDRTAQVTEVENGYSWSVYWDGAEDDDDARFGYGFEEHLEDAWDNAADAMGVEVFTEAKLTVSGSKGDFDSIEAEFGDDVTLKRSGGKLVVTGDGDALRRVKRYCDNELGVDVQEANLDPEDLKKAKWVPPRRDPSSIGKSIHFSGSPAQIAKFKKHADPMWNMFEPKDGGLDVVIPKGRRKDVLDSADYAGLVLDESEQTPIAKLFLAVSKAYNSGKPLGWHAAEKIVGDDKLQDLIDKEWLTYGRSNDELQIGDSYPRDLSRKLHIESARPSRWVKEAPVTEAVQKTSAIDRIRALAKA